MLHRTRVAGRGFVAPPLWAPATAGRRRGHRAPLCVCRVPGGGQGAAMVGERSRHARRRMPLGRAGARAPGSGTLCDSGAPLGWPTAGAAAANALQGHAELSHGLMCGTPTHCSWRTRVGAIRFVRGSAVGCTCELVPSVRFAPGGRAVGSDQPEVPLNLACEV